MSIQEKFQKYFSTYINNNDKNDELEVRFGTKGSKLTKIDFDNVIQKLMSHGFQLVEKDVYTLKMFSEFVDPNTGKTRTSNIRTEVKNMFAIQKYCKTNSIEGEKFYENNITFLQKNKKISNNAYLKPLDFDEYNFRVSYQEEKKLNRSHPLVKTMLREWTNSKKTFRLLKRSTYTHPDFPFVVDVSVVKSSKVNSKNFPISAYTFQDSGLVDSAENYEVEVEAQHENISINDFTSLKKIIKIITAGMQQSNYPIKKSEMQNVISQYKKMVFKNDGIMKIGPRDFIGLSSISLEMENILNQSNTNVANITKNYSVTDKADGLRKLLFVDSQGKIYFITMNMDVQFTGMITKTKECYNSICDGEHVLEDKHNNYLNHYLLFDIYFLDKKDKRALSLYNKESKDSRLHNLHAFSNKLNPTPIISNGEKDLKIKEKTFLVSTDTTDIFSQCKLIMQKEQDGLFDYNIDGLIFTPINRGVGIPVGGEPINKKFTWTESFKWKPPSYNTIDFLVSTKKTQTGNDAVSNIFEQGESTTKEKQLTQYKTLILRVGFDEKKHGFLNPCLDIIQDTLPNQGDRDNRNNYKPVPFYPTNPYIEKAYLCNIILKENSFGEKIMYTEDGKEIIEDNTIVEFRYDGTKQFGFNWIPIKVRYDKTREYKKGIPNYGNAYHVAQSVWRSIHNPITTSMITSGENIPTSSDNLDVYYNRKGAKSQTRALRDFHNLYIKRKLIKSVSQSGNILMDTSVGKAGDLNKWIDANLSFVLGVDISIDNIENKLDGACARYLKTKMKNRNIPRALFLQGNSGLNIKNGQGLYSEKGKRIINALFDKGPKDQKALGKGVYRNFGIAKNGFDVVSTQFALHYFFENKHTCNAFLRNVSECCKVGGYFIGTCYDGKKLFGLLQDVNEGESISKYNNKQKIWEVEKMYDKNEFKDNATSFGYAINVYQESINKSFKEYLVNFNYLTILLENYGFAKLTDSEAKELGLKHSITSFSEYYTMMENEITANEDANNAYGRSSKMSSGEKFVSFLNNCFVFKKIRNVDEVNIENILTNESVMEEQTTKEETEQMQKSSKNVTRKKPRAKKLNKKIKLVMKE